MDDSGDSDGVFYLILADYNTPGLSGAAGQRDAFLGHSLVGICGYSLRDVNEAFETDHFVTTSWDREALPWIRWVEVPPPNTQAFRYGGRSGASPKEDKEVGCWF